MAYPSINPRVFWPSAIVLIQFSNLILLSAFFISSSVTVVPLPDSLARTVKDNPQTTTLVTAVVATLISTLTWNLFSEAIRFAVNIQLTGTGMSLHSMSALTTVTKGTFIFGRLKSIWTYIAALVAFALLLQTAALTAVLSPTTVRLSYPIRGLELDMTNPKFPDLLGPLQRHWTLQPDIQPDTQYTVSPAVLSSGEMAVRARLNLPSFFSFNNYSYIGSTHGILPANLVPMSNVLPSTKSHAAFLPPNSIITEPRRFNGLKSTYTMVQQGYTPSVKCRRENWKMRIEYNASIHVVKGTVDCPGNRYSELNQGVGPEKSTILAVMCPVYTPSFPTAPAAEYDIILKGYGQLYGSLPSCVCRVNSDVTTMEAKYDVPPTLYESDIPNLLNTTTIRSTATTVPRLGYEATHIFLRQVVYGQSPRANSVGNIVSSFYTMKRNDPDSISTIWESYIKGSLEFASTLIRTNMTIRSTPNDTLTIKESDTLLLRNITGTYTIETMGWTQSVGMAHRATFLSPILIIVSSLLLVVYGAVRIKMVHNTPAPTSTYFDPRDTLHVVAASAAGGLEFQPDYVSNGVPNSQRFGVRLDMVNPEVGKIGFVTIQGEGYVPVVNPVPKSNSSDTAYPGDTGMS
ncbi:hypothetical protein AMATHDRAFT_62878 [Amanita thiersii Skay4041]|uniref:Uncharacterized protein n=1 Tax=Amanita thiersii Skay4041 TaxID=703135 RepID=A0A2A9NPC5_9AGAR|nr:hypothetical protein AMATHDRAFT_62878 [Amanita thiersii Skay4041]